MRAALLSFLTLAAVCLVALPLLALSSDGRGDAAQAAVADHDEESKELFADNCGTCHTLAAAGTQGVVGPDLDQRLAPGGSGNFDSNYPRTLTAVVCGFGGGRMPAGILTGQNAKEVAAFVGAYAGQLGADDGPLVDTREVTLAEPGECPTPESATEAPGDAG